MPKVNNKKNKINTLNTLNTLKIVKKINYDKIDIHKYINIGYCCGC